MVHQLFRKNFLRKISEEKSKNFNSTFNILLASPIRLIDNRRSLHAS